MPLATFTVQTFEPFQQRLIQPRYGKETILDVDEPGA